MDALIEAALERWHIPGLAACKIDSGKISWSGYYGHQDIENNIPVTAQSLFMIASVSKTVTAAALMQLYAAGKFELDDDINLYLPFRVVNPQYPATPITFRQLLRHRSSIADNHEYLAPFWNVNQGDPTIPLHTFLKEYLTPQGHHYDEQKNFLQEPPGAQFRYANVGFALLGYLVEEIAHEPFDQYCENNLFTPLDMPSTAWYLKDAETSRVAIPYQYNDSLQQYIRLEHGGYPDYPAGQLRTTAEELAHFLTAWTQNGRWNNRQVLDSATIQTLTPTDFSLGFHTWFAYILDTQTLLYSHQGGDNGVSSCILYDAYTRKGLIMLMNGELTDNTEWRKLIEAIYKDIP